MENTAGRLIKIIIFLAALSGALIFLISVGDLVKLIVIAALLAYIIDPLANLFESRGMSRTSATVVIFSAISLIIAVSLSVFLPILFQEVMAIQSGLDSGETSAVISRIESSIKANLGFMGVKDIDLTEKLHKTMVYIGDWIFSHILDVVSLVIHLVVTPFIIFFLLKDGRKIKRQFISMVPNRYFEFSLNLLYKMDMQLGNYLRGQFLDACVVGILSVFALWLLGVKYFLIIGVFAGLANLIPYLGPVAGVTPAVLITILDSGDMTLAFYIIVAFALIKLVDDALVQPLIVGRSVKMHPLLVLLAIIVGGKFFGILGMILSVPVTGFIKVLIQESVANFRRYRLT